jgi:hypothetical protein
MVSQSVSQEDKERREEFSTADGDDTGGLITWSNRE